MHPVGLRVATSGALAGVFSRQPGSLGMRARRRGSDVAQRAARGRGRQAHLGRPG